MKKEKEGVRKDAPMSSTLLRDLSDSVDAGEVNKVYGDRDTLVDKCRTGGSVPDTALQNTCAGRESM